MTEEQRIITAFREKFNELAVKKSGKEYYALILPKDIHEYDEYGLGDIERFLLDVLRQGKEAGKRAERVKHREAGCTCPTCQSERLTIAYNNSTHPEQKEGE